jgi:hypothetical protein
MHSMPVKDVAEKLGVSQGAVNTWRRDAGIPASPTRQQLDYAKRRADLLADPDIRDGQAYASYDVLAERHHLSAFTVGATLRKLGIKPYQDIIENKPRPQKQSYKTRRPAQDPETVWLAHHLEAWGR